MRHNPTQRNARLVHTILASLLIFGGIAYAVPVVFEARGTPVMPWLFSLLTLVSVVGALYFLMRYKMTTFTYMIRPRSDMDEAEETGMETVFAGAADITRIRPEWLDLVVLKGQGSRAQVMECVLSLGDLAAVIPVTRTGADGGATVKSVRDQYRERAATDFIFYDYTLTYRWETALELVFVDGQRYVGVILEADEGMAAYLKSLQS